MSFPEQFFYRQSDFIDKKFAFWKMSENSVNPKTPKREWSAREENKDLIECFEKYI